MEKFLILLLLLGCKGPDLTKLNMTVSDASEIHFTRTGEKSFNLEEEGYTDDYCFHETFLCSGIRRFQAWDSILLKYDLFAYNCDGAQIFSTPYSVAQSYPGNGMDVFADVPLNQWTNKASGVGQTWQTGLTAPKVILTSGTIGSYALMPLKIAAPAGTYNIAFETINSAVACVLNVNMKKGATVIDNIINIPVPVGTHSGTFEVTLSEWCDTMEVFAFKASGAGTEVQLVSVSTDITAIDATPFVYSASMTPSDEGMCDKKVQFKIMKTKSLDDLADFTNNIPQFGFSTAETWTLGANPSNNISAAGYSYYLSGKIAYYQTEVINYDLDVDKSSHLQVVNLSETNVILNTLASIPLSVGNNSGSVSIPFIANTYRIGFAVYNDTGTALNADINSIALDDVTPVEVFYSDFVDFVSEWSNSSSSGRVDILFKSVQNFDDLFYNESSEYFQIQLDGRFRKERKITAQKVLELTEIVINTATSVKKQRKLMITDVPDYMHTKICAILAHAASGSVLVDGFEITVDGEYEEGTDRPDTYPLSPAEIFLTIKDYYRHNVT